MLHTRSFDIVLIAAATVTILSLSACGLNDLENRGLGALVTKAQLGGACQMPLEDLKTLSHDKFTAGKLSEKAHVIGYKFTCSNSATGKTPWIMYVGWVDTVQGGMYCIHWNKDKQEVINSRAWLSCGGLNS